MSEILVLGEVDFYGAYRDGGLDIYRQTVGIFRDIDVHLIAFLEDVAAE